MSFLLPETGPLRNYFLENYSFLSFKNMNMNMNLLLCILTDCFSFALQKMSNLSVWFSQLT